MASWSFAKQTFYLVAGHSKELAFCLMLVELLGVRVIDWQWPEGGRDKFDVLAAPTESKVKFNLVLVFEVEECNWLIRLQRLGFEVVLSPVLPFHEVFLRERAKLLAYVPVLQVGKIVWNEYQTLSDWEATRTFLAILAPDRNLGGHKRLWLQMPEDILGLRIVRSEDRLVRCNEDTWE